MSQQPDRRADKRAADKRAGGVATGPAPGDDALARLSRSREAIAASWRSAPPGTSGSAGSAVAAWAMTLLSPATTAGWPARDVVRLLVSESGETLASHVRRRPLASVGVAAAAGAALVIVRPWRWGLARSACALAVRRGSRWLAGQLIDLSWLPMLGAWLGRRSDGRAPGRAGSGGAGPGPGLDGPDEADHRSP